MGEGHHNQFLSIIEGLVGGMKGSQVLKWLKDKSPLGSQWDQDY